LPTSTLHTGYTSEEVSEHVIDRYTSYRSHHP
jgi:hypothetical protein